MTALIVADPAAFEACFPHQPFRIRHALAGDARLTLEAILDLMRSLPRDRIEYNSGKASIGQDPDATPVVDLPPEEIIRQIETAGAWMVLKRIESHPTYAALLQEALMSAVAAHGYRSLNEAGFLDVRGFLFVSSPKSLTPFHMDSEANFFVQIHGEKYFSIYDNRDGKIANSEQIEASVSKHRNLKWDEAFEASGVRHHLDPGEGLYAPYQWPHWVETGDAYSISVAITWKTKEICHRNDLLIVNAFLRDRGLPQNAPGFSPRADALKVGAWRACMFLTAPLRRSEIIRRFLRGLVLGKKANYFYGVKASQTK